MKKGYLQKGGPFIFYLIKITCLKFKYTKYDYFFMFFIT